VEYERTGTLEVALNDAQTAELGAVARHLSHAGVAHSWIEAAGVRDLEPLLSDRAAAGLLIPEHGYVRVQALIEALTDACLRREVKVSVARVERVEDATGGQVRVITAADALTADAVVLAAGAWSSRVAITPSAAVPVRPIRGQLLHVQMPQPPLSRVTWGRDCYLVPWRDGSVLIGATVEDAGFAEQATVEGMHQLLTSARELVPALATATFREVRVGLRPVTADELPIVGRSSTMPAVWYGTGHYRNGVLLAPLTAVMLADLILDGRERPELALVRPDRFGL
jgi:glycine oxidase